MATGYRPSVKSKGGHIRLSDETWAWIDQEIETRGISRARFFEYMISRFREATERQRAKEEADAAQRDEDRRSAEQQVPVLPPSDPVP